MIFVNVFMVLIFLTLVRISISLSVVLMKASLMCNYISMFLDAMNKSNDNRSQFISILKKTYEDFHNKGKYRF